MNGGRENRGGFMGSPTPKKNLTRRALAALKRSDRTLRGISHCRMYLEDQSIVWIQIYGTLQMLDRLFRSAKEEQGPPADVPCRRQPLKLRVRPWQGQAHHPCRALLPVAPAGRSRRFLAVARSDNCPSSGHFADTRVKSALANSGSSGSRACLVLRRTARGKEHGVLQYPPRQGQYQLSTGIDLTRWVGSIGLAVSVGVVYFLAARLSLALLTKPAGVAVFWPAAGVSAGVLIALGSRAAWPVVVGTMAATIVANLFGDRNLWSAVLFGFCNAGEAVLTAWLVGLLFGPDFRMDNLPNVLGLAAAASLGDGLPGVSGAFPLYQFYKQVTWRVVTFLESGAS